MMVCAAWLASCSNVAVVVSAGGAIGLLQTCQPAGVGAVDAQWYDDECRLLRLELSCAWTAHLGHLAMLTCGLLLLLPGKPTKRAVHRKKYQYEQQCQIQQLNLFFSSSQRVFWKEFLGKRDSPCPVADVGEWTQWFKHIMGSLPEALHLTPAQTAAKDQLHTVHEQNPSRAECLNEPVHMDEIALIMQGPPCWQICRCHGTYVRTVEAGCFAC
jgi:hypothetical protein